MTRRLDLYDTLAQRCADAAVRTYSTSFALATRTLPADQRVHVRNVYGLVRLADEIVDGAAAEAGGDQRAALDALEADCERAMAQGYSTNVLVHAFARTARHAGFGAELTAPFFASMRMDITRTTHDEASFTAYVDGSAEVVGLMCLRVFLVTEPDGAARYLALEPSARALGAAFQKINFLRDLADDDGRLGRRYFPGIDPAVFTETDKRRILADIDADLTLAASGIAALPPASARAVRVAHALFAELARRLRRTPAPDLLAARVRVPGPVKARLAAAALAGRTRTT
ncbi:phytoene/squalene synthase family protein [Georgenia faecalis]|uniref:Phytoene/squalene synthase family protein n=1 Tax=Georgenia faecalis TaxID=2483799 RepID=A0ABV9D4Z0_9MICO|nr:squalene/phytoene synthase family protein [Georgenia faecalis]